MLVAACLLAVAKVSQVNLGNQTNVGNCAGGPGMCMAHFAVSLKHKISHVTLSLHEIHPTLPISPVDSALAVVR